MKKNQKMNNSSVKNYNNINNKETSSKLNNMQITEKNNNSFSNNCQSKKETICDSFNSKESN